MSNQPDSKFWLVWRGGGQPPMYRHGSHAGASNEAERLARQNPGERLYVLEAKEMMCLPLPDLERTILVDDDCQCSPADPHLWCDPCVKRIKRGEAPLRRNSDDEDIPF